MWIDNRWDDEFSISERAYDELLEENYRLKKQVKELEAFRDSMVNATTNVTNAWVKEILAGNIKLK